MCLKYLRDRNYLDIFNQLELRTGFRLEHELISRLYDTLVRNITGWYNKLISLLLFQVVNGDVSATEEILFHAHNGIYIHCAVELVKY